ncbi:uncharacterized protein LOC123652278 isoform X1 [Pipistrellus kuhlii]|uniref:uncharacterized protein LOC123652278 isoform X1 n=1 Tax=Pipistrellus kuhlii TaxID=59472 RepID=UPI001E274950|nr:uncharacterized protein LOC123652278 isoform X1 [Pipistrellus kuhlii]
MTEPTGNAEEEEDDHLMTQTKEAQSPAAGIGSLMTEPTGNAEEEEDDHLMTQTKEAQSPAAGIGSLMTEPTGNAEEEEDDHLMTQTKEAQSPAAGMRKHRSRLRTMLRFFQRQRHGSRGQATSPAESAPGSPEATPAGSGRLEDRDTGSEPLPKGRRRWPGCRRAVKGRMAGLPRGQGRSIEKPAGCAHVCLEAERGAPHTPTHARPLTCVDTQVENVNPRLCCGGFVPEPFSTFSIRSLPITDTVVGPRVSRADFPTVTAETSSGEYVCGVPGLCQALD